ncbi:Uncharacterised protein [uncultured archaeon]|nr:Uncharacterised protein [uncultured archaeon]
MSIVCDTDVLSAFAKIDRLILLSELFPKHKIVTTNGVYEELIFIKHAGYDFVDRIIDVVEIISMDAKELEKYHSFLSSTSFGKGELQCISICVTRNYPFITNDKKAKRFAEKNEVIAWDIPDIMKALWKTEIRSKEEVEGIMDDLEIKDMMIINNKEKILK